jgi:uncharacterized membrane protein YoaK (UPF0700 family)
MTRSTSAVTMITGVAIVLLGAGIVASTFTGNNEYILPLAVAVMGLSAAVAAYRRSSRVNSGPT